MRVKWAWRSILNEIKDWFFRRKLKKSKHLEHLNLGSERRRLRELGLSLERRDMVVVLRGFEVAVFGVLEINSMNS